MRLLRTAIAAVLLVLSGQALADDPKTYKLTIGDVSVEINPGETVDLTLPGGQKTTVTLALNEFTAYSGKIFSFVHPTSVAVAKTDLGDGIFQHLMASATGTLVIVQEYDAMNPVALNQLMIQELTKESVQAGAEMSQEPTTRTLADGKQLSGLKATVTSRTEKAYFEVLSYGVTDRGVVLVTRIDDENTASEGSLLAKFWETLQIKL
jgi:hypothetical protein